MATVPNPRPAEPPAIPQELVDGYVDMLRDSARSREYPYAIGVIQAVTVPGHVTYESLETDATRVLHVRAVLAACEIVRAQRAAQEAIA